VCQRLFQQFAAVETDTERSDKPGRLFSQGEAGMFAVSLNVMTTSMLPASFLLTA
jgi:hypothetical protein